MYFITIFFARYVFFFSEILKGKGAQTALLIQIYSNDHSHSHRTRDI